MDCKICQSGKLRVIYNLPEFDLLECQDCRFRFIPYLDPEQTPQPSCITEDQIEHVSKYAQTHLEQNSQRLENLVSLLKNNVKEGGRVLDVGCGSGHFLKAIIESYPSIGIEPSAVRRKISQRKGLTVYKEPLDHPRWHASHGAFDAITMWDVIEHVNWPNAAAQKVYELLSPGGVFLLDTPSRDGLLYQFGNLTARLTNGRFPTTMGVQYSPTPFNHKQIFRIEDMRKMLCNVGFDVDIKTQTEFSMPPSYYLKAMIRSEGMARVLTPLATSLLGLIPFRNKMAVVARKI